VGGGAERIDLPVILLSDGSDPKAAGDLVSRSGVERLADLDDERALVDVR
jgi:hypothetical protein